MQGTRARKIRDAADAVRCLGQVSESGLALRDWAHNNGIDARSLNIWQVILERSRRTRSPAEFRLIELVSTPPKTVKPVYRIRCMDVVVELDADFDDSVVARLLRLVRAC